MPRALIIYEHPQVLGNTTKAISLPSDYSSTIIPVTIDPLPCINWNTVARIHNWDKHTEEGSILLLVIT